MKASTHPVGTAEFKMTRILSKIKLLQVQVFSHNKAQTRVVSSLNISRIDWHRKLSSVIIIANHILTLRSKQ
jgi:hypothetical protein